VLHRLSHRNAIGLHPALAAGFFSALGSLGATLAAETAMRRFSKPSPGQSPEKVEGQTMSDMYDILGHSLRGSVGSAYRPSLIGDDPSALLEALAVSGGLEALISGAGNTEIVGADSSARKQILEAVAERNAGAVIQRELDRRRRYPLGVVPTDINPGVQQQIPASPQNLFRPERLVIPSDIAFDSGVVDVKVGNVSQFVQSAEVPGALFSEVAINTGVNFDTAEIGNQISAVIRNKGAAAIEFSAGFVGTIAK